MTLGLVSALHRALDVRHALVQREVALQLRVQLASCNVPLLLTHLRPYRAARLALPSRAFAAGRRFGVGRFLHLLLKWVPPGLAHLQAALWRLRLTHSLSLGLFSGRGVRPYRLLHSRDWHVQHWFTYITLISDDAGGAPAQCGHGMRAMGGWTGTEAAVGAESGDPGQMPGESAEEQPLRDERAAVNGELRHA